MVTTRPTRAEHLAECDQISIAMTAKIRQATELLQFHASHWTPAPCPRLRNAEQLFRNAHR